MIIIIAIVAGFIPCIALFLWLRNGLNREETYRKLCDYTLLRGFLCTFSIILLSGLLYLLLRLTRIQDGHPLLFQLLYTFIVLAFAEEFVKYRTFRRVLKKKEYPYSFLDFVVLMSIVGIGFDISESLLYAIGASVPVVLVRGICIPHAGYGFITGYFYGKGIKTGRTYYKYLGFLLSWAMHGLYDFSLSEEFVVLNENLVFVALTLAAADIVLWVSLIVFSKKARNILNPAQ